MRPWILAECNYGHIKQAHYDVAVLPFGATEPHNLHLPYSTDTIEADEIGSRVCEAAHARGAKVILLPTIPYGTETNQAAFPLSLNLNPSTIQQILADLVASLVGSGIKKVLILNSHGGNEFKPMLRELYGQTPAALFLCNWFQMVRDVYSEIFAMPEDHAGEMETSLLLHFRPDLVAKTPDGSLIADEGLALPTRFEAVNRGWVSITRPWHLLTTNSGSGNPHAATAAKGEQLMEVVVDRLATFLVELSKSDVDERFPF
jgi:creatinine amidohydrolase